MRLLISIILFALHLPLLAEVSVKESAFDYCRGKALDKIEGIWEFPEDETTVLIRKSGREKKEYDIIVLSTPDCRLIPGDVIGKVSPSVDPSKWHLSLYGMKKGNILTDLRECVATFNDREGTIKIERPKVKISLRYTRFLPKFWRILSIFNITEPATKIPEGLIRIFPAPHGEPIPYSLPFYL